MTESVVTASVNDTVESIVESMLGNRISAIPIVDAEGRVLGIVSEGDLLNRPEAETRHRSKSWWLTLLAGPGEQAVDFLKVYGRTAADVMTRTVVTVNEDESVASIAEKLERHRIKRVPVVRDGKLVGIVSRANLLRCFGQAVQKRPVIEDAAALRTAIFDKLGEAGIRAHWVNVIVTGDAVELWGAVETPVQLTAATAAAQSVASSRKVVNNLAVMDRSALSRYGGL